uniref:Uncharacterized protein n=1 Tax=Anguilla anguilla TaxID=7936 RepID=A0A0E9Q8F5_ANGAN
MKWKTDEGLKTLMWELICITLSLHLMPSLYK